jgi:ribosomal protein S1
MTLPRRFAVAVAAPILLWSGTIVVQTVSPPPQKGNTPQTVEGQVIKIDRAQGRVTIRAADGVIHEFQASKDTLQDLKEGDRIEARLRKR